MGIFWGLKVKILTPNPVEFKQMFIKTLKPRDSYLYVLFI